MRPPTTYTIRAMMKENPMSTTPEGRPFPRFPTLTEMTHGLQGIFILAGRTGIGKSTLAAHLAADAVGPDFPGVYYESENRLVSWDGDRRIVRSLAVDRMRHAY